MPHSTPSTPVNRVASGSSFSRLICGVQEQKKQANCNENVIHYLDLYSPLRVDQLDADMKALIGLGNLRMLEFDFQFQTPLCFIEEWVEKMREGIS